MKDPFVLMQVTPLAHGIESHSSISSSQSCPVYPGGHRHSVQFVSSGVPPFSHWSPQTEEEGVWGAHVTERERESVRERERESE